ncbi:MAG: TerB family tellurite resistance protein, partial [Thalassotalea sp.]|nr:TerB family tellurite resistance protein [Thalassotalea sp.]
AYADGVLDAIEEHIIRRIADLLHLRHGEYIQCKLKIQNQVNANN